MNKPKKYLVNFYADSWKYGKNYLFRFGVDSEREGKSLAKKFQAKAAWLVDQKNNLEKRII